MPLGNKLLQNCIKRFLILFLEFERNVLKVHFVYGNNYVYIKIYILLSFPKSLSFCAVLLSLYFNNLQSHVLHHGTLSFYRKITLIIYRKGCIE